MKVILNPKNGKNSTNSDNYRPISLTSFSIQNQGTYNQLQTHMIPRIERSNHQPSTWIP